MRVVSLLPSATEIVFALGRGADLVGVSFECDFPEEARARRIVSTSALPAGLSAGEIDAAVSARLEAGEDLYHLDEGALATLHPDVVLTQDLCAVCAVPTRDVDEALVHLGCAAKVVTLDPSSLQGILDSVHVVGAALGAATEASALVASLGHRLDELHAAIAGISRPLVLVLEWTDPPFSAGHWVPDIVHAGGGRAVMGDAGRNSRRRTWEEVSAATAEVVVVAPCGYHLGGSRELAAAAVATGRLPHGAVVWAVDADAYFVRPGPRVVDGAELIGRILHPEVLGPPQPSRAQHIA